MGTTVFSIAHRLELRKFHQFELYLKGDGSGQWELKELPEWDHLTHGSPPGKPKGHHEREPKPQGASPTPGTPPWVP